MNKRPTDPRRDGVNTLLCILVPMWLTFIGLRLYLHGVDSDADLFVAGYNIHHLFTGALIEIPCAFVLAMGVRIRSVRILAEVGLGIGCAMILDELIYLITTDGTNASYLLPISLWGAAVMHVLATGLLLLVYRLAGRRPQMSRSWSVGHPFEPDIGGRSQPRMATSTVLKPNSDATSSTGRWSMPTAPLG